jgi:DNA-binding NtrC family response regulator
MNSMKTDLPKMENPASHPKVLVVEDDLSLKTVMTRIFSSVRPDFEITWVPSAESALAKLSQQSYDLVFADVYLSGIMTGLDLWTYCYDRLPAMNFVLISNLGVNQFFDLVGRERIAPPFLPKPFYVGECKELVSSLLKLKDPNS